MNEILKEGKILKLILKVIFSWICSLTVIGISSGIMDLFQFDDYGTLFFSCTLWVILVVLFLFFSYYLIKEFKIKEILKIYGIEKNKNLICKKNRSVFCWVLFGIIFLIILKIKLTRIFQIIALENILTSIILYFIGVSLPIKFVKNRLENNELKVISVFNKIIIFVVILFLVYISNYIFPEYRYTHISIFLKLIILIVLCTCLECGIVYKILEKNGYFEKNSSH